MIVSGSRSGFNTPPASFHQEKGANGRGKLKIFFGMSPGVGKTYSMLKTAHEDLERGVDVVVGYIDSYDRPDTNALLKGLEIIPSKKLMHNDAVVEEMDLDAIIARKPYLVIVDELAHTNAEGSRHAKRYQDVRELLDNGINVYTTLNIQNLESRCDIIARMTGVPITDFVPDEMFEITDDVELVDITSTALLERFAQGKICNLSQLKETERNFFRKRNIAALREMSIRLVADRVGKQFQSYMQQSQIEVPWKQAGLHLLVLVTESEFSEKLLRWAKSLSYTIGANLVALYIESGEVLDEAQREQLPKNIDLAREFGAEVIITSGSDIVATILDVARKENITHIVVEQSCKRGFLSRFYSKSNFVGRLLRESGDINIHVVKSDKEERKPKRKDTAHQEQTPFYKNYLFAFLAISIVVVICLPVSSRIGYQPISFILLFVVMLLSLFFSLGPVMMAAVLGTAAWYFFFIPQSKSVGSKDILDVLTFFIIALVTGTLTSRLRRQERLTRKREERTNALFHLTNQLAVATNFNDIMMIAKDEIHRYFGVDTYFILQDGLGTLTQKADVAPADFTDSEFASAQWVYKYSKKAGKHTDTLSGGEYTLYPLDGVYTKPGVVAVKPKKKFNGEMELFWNTFLVQISNALEHYYYNLRTKKADLLFESDKLYRSLFNSVSHEFRTPVAAIMGASELLLNNQCSETIRRELYGEIFTASNRLSRLVDNLLNISRLENKKIAPHIDWVDVNDLFGQVMHNLEDDLKAFRQDIVVPGNMPLVKLDFGLMEQALYNLVDNSCKYGEPGTTIRLQAFYDNGYLVIQEMNRGIGFPPDELPLVFSKFYRGEDRTSDGIGLGLSIVKGFVEAHDGTISVENRQNGGVKFTIKIPTDILYIV